MKVKSINIEKIIETVFIHKWSTYAHILESGKITVAWQYGRIFTEEQFLQEFKGKLHEVNFILPRLEVYKELKKYYTNKFDINKTS